MAAVIDLNPPPTEEVTAIPESCFTISDAQLADLYRDVENLVQNEPKAVAQQSFAFFCMEYLGEHFSAGFANFQHELFEYLEELRPGQHSLFLFPREHGKSTLFNFAFSLWSICYRRKRHIMIVSAVKETSEKFLANIKGELATNQKILRDFGDLVWDVDKKARTARPNRTTYIKTTNFVVVVATSTNGTVRGTIEALPFDLEKDFLGRNEDGTKKWRMRNLRPDLIICDDVVDDKLILTKQTRNRTWDWFWKNLFSAQQNELGNVIVVGTTLHQDDLVSRLWDDRVQTERWFKRKMPAANPDNPFDEHGNPVECLFPEKWGRIDYNRPIYTQNPLTGATDVTYRSYLWHRWRELGAAFGPEFLMKPFDESTKFFAREDFGHYVVHSPSTQQLKDVTFRTTGKMLEDLPSDLICVTAVDPAATDQKRLKQGAEADYTVVCTMGYSPHTRKMYVLAVDRLRCSPFVMMHRIMVHIQMFSKTYGGKYVGDPEDPQNTTIYGFPFLHLGVAVETVAFQKVLASMLEELTISLGMYPLVIQVNRGQGIGKVTRAQLPSHLSKMGLVMFPYPVPGTNYEVFDACFHELVNFPGGDEHDDFVDAFTDCCHILHGYSLNLGRGGMGMGGALQDLLSGRYGYKTTQDNVDEIIASLEHQYTSVPRAQFPNQNEVYTHYRSFNSAATLV